MSVLRFLPLVVLALAGCGSPPAAPTPAAAADGFPQTVTDATGFTATLPARPVRIVSTAPSNTELLFAIGAGEQVVGVTTLCDYPPEAAGRAKIGGFAPKTISSETVLSLNPDLVLTAGGMQRPLADSLRQLNLTVLTYDAQTLPEVVADVRRLGALTGHAAEATALADRLEARANRVRERVAAVPADRRPGVLLLLGDNLLLTAGPKTLPGQLLDAAGGRNVFADAGAQYPTFSEEELIRRNPDVILTWQMNDAATTVARVAGRPAWQGLKAVREKRVLHLDDALLSRAGPRAFDGLEQLADLLHPRK